MELFSSASPSARHKKAIIFASCATALGIIVEIAASILSGSLALQSDALHMMTDLVILGIFGAAVYLAKKPATAEKPFGWQRMDVVGTFINSFLLFVVALFIVFQAWFRLQNPNPIHGPLMLSAAVIGLLINVASAWFVQRQKADLIGRNLVIHLVSDSLSSLAVVIAAIGFLVFRQTWIDPVASIAIAILIIILAAGRFWEGSKLALGWSGNESAARQMREAICGLPEILEVSELRVVSVGMGIKHIAVHVVISDRQVSHTEELWQAIDQLMHRQFGACAFTVQFEASGQDHHHI